MVYNKQSARYYLKGLYWLLLRGSTNTSRGNSAYCWWPRWRSKNPDGRFAFLSRGCYIACADQLGGPVASIY